MTVRIITRWLAVLALTGIPILLAAVTSPRPQSNALPGEKRFEECASCHSLAAGENGSGPTLKGIFNRKAASIEEFRYSTAMRNSGIRWTAETLDTFIADPQKAIPGNRMAYAGLTDVKYREELIEYLMRATK